MFPISIRFAATIVLAAALFGWTGCRTSSPEDRSSERDRAAEESPSKQGSSEQKPSLDELAETLPNGANPFDGVLTSGQPEAEDLTRMPGRVRTVLNLRPHDESGARNEKDELGEMGIDYAHLPIGGADDLTRRNVDRFAELLEKADRPILVHCSSSNRVGAFFALRAFWHEEASRKEALELGRRAGLRALEDAVRERMASKGDE